MQAPSFPGRLHRPTAPYRAAAVLRALLAASAVTAACGTGGGGDGDTAALVRAAKAAAERLAGGHTTPGEGLRELGPLLDKATATAPATAPTARRLRRAVEFFDRNAACLRMKSQLDVRTAPPVVSSRFLASEGWVGLQLGNPDHVRLCMSTAAEAETFFDLIAALGRTPGEEPIGREREITRLALIGSCETAVDYALVALPDRVPALAAALAADARSGAWPCAVDALRRARGDQPADIAAALFDAGADDVLRLNDVNTAVAAAPAAARPALAQAFASRARLPGPKGAAALRVLGNIDHPEARAAVAAFLDADAADGLHRVAAMRAALAAPKPDVKPIVAAARSTLKREPKLGAPVVRAVWERSAAAAPDAWLAAGLGDLLSDAAEGTGEDAWPYVVATMKILGEPGKELLAKSGLDPKLDAGLAPPEPDLKALLPEAASMQADRRGVVRPGSDGSAGTPNPMIAPTRPLTVALAGPSALTGPWAPGVWEGARAAVLAALQACRDAQKPPDPRRATLVAEAAYDATGKLTALTLRPAGRAGDAFDACAKAAFAAAVVGPARDAARRVTQAVTFSTLTPR